MTGEPVTDCGIHQGKDKNNSPVPEPAMKVRRPASKVLIILVYLGVFWVLLPAFLFAAGFLLDRLLPVSLGDPVPGWIPGWVLTLSGFLLMADSMARLSSLGRGLPISHLPPTEFVTSGAYRYLRHPIYVGYTAAFAGAAMLFNSFWSLAFSTPLLLIGWIAYAVFYEEPVLRVRFGERYASYIDSTPLLLPKGITRLFVHVPGPIADQSFKTLDTPANRTILFQSGFSRETSRRTVNAEKRNAPQSTQAAFAGSSWIARQLRGAGDSERLFFIKRGLVLYFLWVVVFEGLGRYAATLPTHDPTWALDDRIPLIPVFIWPYLFCYLFALLPGFVAIDWHRVCRGILSILIANLTAFVVYLAYPVAFPKPDLGSTLAERLIRLEYVVDFHPGGNNLPSLHVIFAWLVYFICLRQGLKRITEYTIFLTASLITLSTLLVKQHILADVIAGIAWAAASWQISGFLYLRWRLRDGDAKEAFHGVLRRLVPFFAASVFLMALFAIPR